MTRTVFLIDGFNLYHSLDEKSGLHKYKWLDLRTLARQFMNPWESLEAVYYFTAINTWDQSKAARHKRYIKVLKDSGVEVVLGKFKMKDKKCRRCGTVFKTPEEKRTDVNIALYLFKLATLDRYDTAILITGDTDIAPAVETVKEVYPKKRVGVIFPINRLNLEMRSVADFDSRIQVDHLRQSRFADIVVLKNGKRITCPPGWK